MVGRPVQALELSIVTPGLASWITYRTSAQLKARIDRSQRMWFDTSLLTRYGL